MEISNVRQRGASEKTNRIGLMMDQKQVQTLEHIYYQVFLDEKEIGLMFNFANEYWMYRGKDGEEIQGVTKRSINLALEERFNVVRQKKGKIEKVVPPTKEKMEKITMKKQDDNILDDMALYEIERRWSLILSREEVINGQQDNEELTTFIVDINRLLNHAKATLPASDGTPYSKKLKIAILDSGLTIDEIVQLMEESNIKIKKMHLMRLQNGNIIPPKDEISVALAKLLNINELEFLTLAYMEKIPPEILSRLMQAEDNKEE